MDQCLMLWKTVLPLISRASTPALRARLPMSQKTAQNDRENTGVKMAKEP